VTVALSSARVAWDCSALAVKTWLLSSACTTVTASSDTPSSPSAGSRQLGLRPTPVLLGAQACWATGSVLVRYLRYEALSATEAEQASFRAIAAACRRHGLAVVDHLVVKATSDHDSAFQGGT